MKDTMGAPKKQFVNNSNKVQQSITILTICLLIFLLVKTGGSRDIYVATNGAGGGDPVFGAWENASSNIQWAVNVGANGDNVWISNGTYVLTKQITIHSNIAVYGFTNNGPVVINGNKSNRCFYFNSKTTGTLANLFITGGYANDFGAGVYIRAGVVRDCILSNNFSAANGGGMYFQTGSGVIQRCSFVNNKAHNGGGLYLQKSSNVWIDACFFLANTASNSAGGLYCFRGNNLVITNSFFVSNLAVSNDCGGGAHLYFGSNNIMTHCTLSSNVAMLNQGGGLRMRGEGWTVSRSLINHNISLNAGGGIFMREGLVKNCVIARNISIMTNGAARGGGGIYAYDDPSGINFIQDCIVENNRAGYEGGGIFVGGAIVENCLIRNNIASGPGDGRGGGVRIAAATVSLINCTIVSNYAGNTGGGGIYNSYGIKVENCIIYNNASRLAASSNYYNSSVDASFSNCCFAPALDAACANYSANNITADPQFVDRASGNYHLKRESPCVNSGVNRDWMISPGGTVDLDGRPRVDKYSGIVDMGCYEYMPVGTTNVNLKSELR